MPKSALQKEILCGEEKDQRGQTRIAKPISAEQPNGLTRRFGSSFSSQVAISPLHDSSFITPLPLLNHEN
jgi:hypothetical protein